MKLHIECLQEKVDNLSKEKDSFNRLIEDTKVSYEVEHERLQKIVSNLEDDLKQQIQKSKDRDGIYQKEEQYLKDKQQKLEFQINSLQQEIYKNRV